VSRVVSVFGVLLAVLAGAATTAAAATAPYAKTVSAIGVTPVSATIRGTVDPHGVPTAFYFRIGTSKAYGTRTTTGDAGFGTKGIPVSAPLTGLRPRTTYHYELVAFSTAGTSRGGDRTFRTPQIPTTSSLSSTPNPIGYGGVVTITGALTGPDVAGKKVTLIGTPFPFTTPFQQIGNTVLTTPQGLYSFLVPMVITMQLRVVDQSKPGVASPVLTQSVALTATLHVRRARRGRIRFAGRVTPARVGNPVLIQRLTKRGWATVAITLTRAKTTASSRFSRRLRLRRGGRYRALVKTTNGDYVDGASRTVKIRGRR